MIKKILETYNKTLCHLLDFNSPSVTILSSSGFKMASRGSSCTVLWPRSALPVIEGSSAMELIFKPANRQTDRHDMSKKLKKQKQSVVSGEESLSEFAEIILIRSYTLFLSEHFPSAKDWNQITSSKIHFTTFKFYKKTKQDAVLMPLIINLSPLPLIGTILSEPSFKS